MTRNIRRLAAVWTILALPAFCPAARAAAESYSGLEEASAIADSFRLRPGAKAEDSSMLAESIQRALQGGAAGKHGGAVHAEASAKKHGAFSNRFPPKKAGVLVPSPRPIGPPLNLRSSDEDLRFKRTNHFLAVMAAMCLLGVAAMAAGSAWGMPPLIKIGGFVALGSFLMITSVLDVWRAPRN